MPTRVRSIGLGLGRAGILISVMLGPHLLCGQELTRQTRTGTSLIGGHVVDADSSAPLARATVTLIHTGFAAKNQLSDGNGAFRFSGLGPGTYSLLIEKSSYMTTAYPEVRRTLKGRLARITLTEGDVVADLVVKIGHGCVVRGIVTDPFGDPVEGAAVRLMRLTRAENGRLVDQSRQGVTNDAGEFRFGKVEPGDYLAVATPRSPAHAEGDHDRAPTFYPGVASPVDAQAIPVKGGGGPVEIQIQLIDDVLPRINGIVVGPDGNPIASAHVSASLVLDGEPQPGTGGSANTSNDGTFSLRLSPGDYELTAVQVPFDALAPAPNGDKGSIAIARGALTMPVMTELSGSVRTQVQSNTSGIVIPLTRGGVVSGRMRFDGAVRSEVVADVSRRLKVFLAPDGKPCRPGLVKLEDDLSFKITGVGGHCVLRVAGLPSDWSVHAMNWNALDLVNRTVDLNANPDVRDVDVVLSAYNNTISIDVYDSFDRSTHDYVALAYPTDQNMWSGSRRYPLIYLPPAVPGVRDAARVIHGDNPIGIQSQTSTPQGDRFAAVPIGEFFVVAVDDIDDETLHDPDALNILSRRAARVRVTEHSMQAITLRRVERFMETKTR
jgi:Carboxypeptidase regulatory-like domain